MNSLRVLVLYAHPDHDCSRTNRVLRVAIEDMPGVTVHDLYERYPDLFIDARLEQSLLLEHDVLVFQHPMLWYSAPPIIKEWQYSVLENGWAYGTGGDKLRGKHFMQAISTGGHENSYQRGGKANFTVPELLRPFEQMAHYCGMVYLPPFVTHDARDVDDSVIAARAADYRTLMDAMHRGEVPAPFHTIPGKS